MSKVRQELSSVEFVFGAIRVVFIPRPRRWSTYSIYEVSYDGSSIKRSESVFSLAELNVPIAREAVLVSLLDSLSNPVAVEALKYWEGAE